MKRNEDFDVSESVPVLVVEVLSPSRDGDYVETTRVNSGDSGELNQPFPLRIAPGEWTPLD